MKKLGSVVLAAALACGAVTATPAIASASTNVASSPTRPQLKWVHYGAFDSESECNAAGENAVGSGDGEMYNCLITHSGTAVWWDLYVLID